MNWFGQRFNSGGDGNTVGGKEWKTIYLPYCLQEGSKFVYLF